MHLLRLAWSRALWWLAEKAGPPELVSRSREWRLALARETHATILGQKFRSWVAFATARGLFGLDARVFELGQPDASRCPTCLTPISTGWERKVRGWAWDALEALQAMQTAAEADTRARREAFLAAAPTQELDPPAIEEIARDERRSTALAQVLLELEEQIYITGGQTREEFLAKVAADRHLGEVFMARHLALSRLPTVVALGAPPKRIPIAAEVA